jgi:hypothetical protein
MADLEFAFDKREFQALVEDPATSFIVISVGSLKENNPEKPEEPEKSETYFFAQSYDPKSKLNDHLRPLIACPNPPGWLPGTAALMVTHTQLNHAPKFKFAAAELKQKLPTSLFKGINGEEVFAVLAGNSLQTGLSVEMSFCTKDAAGTTLSGTTGTPF